VVLAVMVMTITVSVIVASPASAAVVVKVDPSTGLADGQPVTVTGSGFKPNISVGSAECSAAVSTSRNTSDCDLSTSRTGNSDGSGGASFVLRLKRTIQTQNGTVDCATAASPCVVGMADLSDFTTSSGMTITFDPNAPPLPPPVVAANPSSGLVDRQQVAVNASGFIPGENVLVQECAASDLAKCAAGLFGVGGGTADPTGAIAVGITVRRAIYVDGTRLDCASAVGACVVTAQAAGGPLGRTNLGFDGSKPLPPPPAITVTPSTGLADRQIVRVSGSGFTPSNPVVMTQCKAGATLVSGDCSISVYRQAVTSADGTFSATLEVRTHVDTFGPNGQPSTLDCSVSASTCVVNALDESDFPTNASAPISFDPNASPLPPPSATVIPSTGLVDGQTVRVAADGFPPGASLFVVQCKAGAVDANSCDLSTLQSGNVDDAGHLQGDFLLKRVLTLSSPPPPVAKPVEPVSRAPAPATAALFSPPPPSSNDPAIDCASAPGACTLSVAFLGPTIEAAVVPLAFDATVPPPSGGGGGSGMGSSGSSGGSGSVPPATAPTTTPASVEGVSVNRTPGPVSSTALPRTGLDVRRVAEVDASILALGVIALYASRRVRRRVATSTGRR
jgi:hypothetical protein